MRPEIFREPFIALCNIPYSLGYALDGSAAEGGVLSQGQVVWIKTSAVPPHSLKSEIAFLEEVGIISVDPHWLVPASLVSARVKG